MHTRGRKGGVCVQHLCQPLPRAKVRGGGGRREPALQQRLAPPQRGRPAIRLLQQLYQAFELVLTGRGALLRRLGVI